MRLFRMIVFAACLTNVGLVIDDDVHVGGEESGEADLTSHFPRGSE